MERISCRTGILTARHIVSTVLFALAIAAAVIQTASSALAQIVPVPIERNAGANADPDAPPGAFLPVDRDTTRQWDKAKKLLDEGRYGDGIALLDQILQRGEDYFLPAQPNQPRRSLKAEARRLIGELPVEGLNSYELQFGAQARQMLESAASSGDIPQLEEIARRYFHTQAGYEATLLLGRYQLDHNRPLAAAQSFKRLFDTPAAAEKFEPGLSVMLAACWSRSGMDDRAKQVLVELRKKSPRAKIQIANKDVALFGEDRQALAWLQNAVGTAPARATEQLDEWLLARGNPERNPNAKGGAPLLNPRWRVSTTNHPDLEKKLVDGRKSFIDSNTAALPVMQPLAVGNMVLMRNSRGLLAVDFESGKRIWWPLLSESSLEQKIAKAAGATNGIEPALIERFWQDATYGTLASDGERAYLIDDLDSGPDVVGQDQLGGQLIIQGGGNVIINGQVIRGGVRRFNFNEVISPYAAYNKLTAVELKSEGKIKWVVGGQSGEDEPKLAGAFFLGPPLPLQDKLYALAEIKQEIKLVALDSKTGKLDWSQQVAIAETNIQFDPYRRLAGCTPSYADGVMVCPTTTGAIVAIDVANRSLLWGYEYANPQRVSPTWVQRNGAYPQMSQSDRWQDANVIIADGKVIATPFESPQLHCINLLDGTKAWKNPVDRGDDLYVAGVHDGKVLLVGKRRMTARSLADGSQAWSKAELPLPPPAMPSGRGYLSGGTYFLPLTTAEVLQIDVNDARVVGKVKSRKGVIPGNLVCFQGQVISQGVDYVETYFQRDVLEQKIATVLADTPDDAWALAHRAEIELDQGKLDEAIADVRKAYQQDPSPFTRDLIIEALIAGLSKDFAKYRDDVTDLEKLVRSDAERSALLRVLAAGLQKSGNAVAAIDAYLKIAALEPRSSEPEEIDANLAAARSAWVRAQFQMLLKSVNANERGELDAAIDERIALAIAEKGPKALREFLTFFGDHRSADRAREALVERLSGADTFLERERLLLQLAASNDLPRRAAATAQLAALLREANRIDESRALYRQLQTEHGETPVLNGRNVTQILESLPAGSPLRTLPTANPAWPIGQVKVERSAPKSPNFPGGFRTYPIELRGAPGPFFDDVSIAFSTDNQQLVGYDGLGKERFRLALNDGNQTTTFSNPVAGFAMVRGHVLVVSTGMQVLAFDTLRGTNGRLLWKRDLAEPVANGMFYQPNAVQQPWGARRPAAQPNSQPLGLVGPCTNYAVYFQRGHEVYAIDPLSGNTLWIRRGVEPGSEIFGDEEVILIAPPGRDAKTEAKTIVVRAADGQLLGECTVPGPEQRWATFGRNMLVVRPLASGGQTIAMLDPWGKRDDPVWTMNVGNGMKGTIVHGEAAAIMQPDGKFSLLALKNGARQIDQQLEPERNLENIYYLRSGEQDILITDRNTTGASVRAAQTYLDYARPEITGNIYAFDRQSGMPMWPAPARVAQQQLAIDLPTELPLLVFTRVIQSPQPTRSGAPRGTILCIDKRTGRLLFEDDSLPQLNGTIEAVGNSETKTVSLQLPPQAFALTFSEKPVAPEPPYQAGAFEKPLEGTKAGAFIRAMGGLLAPVMGNGLLENGRLPANPPAGAR